MNRNIFVLVFSAFLLPVAGQDTLRFSGQFSSWLNINPESDLPLWAGIRYIPQINYGLAPGKAGHFDTELSLNIYGNAGWRSYDSIPSSVKIKPYRVWARYSSEQLEIRAGLQKLNFGSAMMLRPLMWFDQMDPRDPLQLTDGVWGILGRYYFLNNANIWLWGLYGNNKPRGWDAVPVNKRIPEFGGRIQIPVPAGEAGITYHHRVADSRVMGSEVIPLEKIPENRIGIDAKWDMEAGFWFEGSFTHKSRNIGNQTNQFVATGGADYTFPVGNGIYAALEQLFIAFGEPGATFSNSISFSLLTASYPVGLSDKLSAIIFYSWNDRNIYSFINWQKQFKRTILYVMAYWNPETYNLPARTSTQNILTGKGVQLLFVFNH